MTRQELLVVAIRLLAIALVLVTLRAIPSTILALTTDQIGTPAALSVSIGSHIALLLLAAALWKFPFGVATLLLPTVGETSVPFPWSQRIVIETGSIVIGLFYAFYAVSDLIYWLTYLVAFGASDHLDASLLPDQWAGIVTTFAEVGISLVLIFGASGVGWFVYATRYAGKAPHN